MASASMSSPTTITEAFFSEVLALDCSEDEWAEPPAKQPRISEGESASSASASRASWLASFASSAAAPPRVAATATTSSIVAGFETTAVSPTVRDWRDPLREALRGRLRMLGRQRRDIVMDSLCSGTDTEAYSIRQAGLVHIAHRDAVECAAFPDAFLTEQGEPKSACWYGCVREYASSAAALFCRRHNTYHPRPTGAADMLCGGIVCRPYSLQRTRRFECQNVEKHVDFDIAEHVLAHVRKAMPRMILIENVGGWDKLSRAQRAEGCETYMETFVADLRAIGYEVRSITLDTTVWSNVRRPRIYVIATIRTASSAAAMDDVVSLIGHCVATRARAPARQVEPRTAGDHRRA